VHLRAEPRYPNLNPATCFVVPVLSKTHIRLFWSFSFYEYIDWIQRKRFGKMEWITEEVPLRSDQQLLDVINSIGTKFFAFLEEPVKVKWGEDSLLVSEPAHQTQQKKSHEAQVSQSPPNR
jgi:hypothetical protein